MKILTKATQKAAPTAPEDLTNKQFVDDRIINHTHPISQIIDLLNQLGELSPNGHTHNIAQIANLQANLNAKANLASPVFSGTPQVPTAAAGSTNQIANTAYVESRAEAHASSQAVHYYNTLRNELLPKISSGSTPRPTKTAGLGHFIESSELSEAHSNPGGVGTYYYYLPAGGTWAILNDGRILAGGAQVGGGSTRPAIVAWRIA